jgi:hypothetical protein
MSNEIRQVAITTTDNPFDPFDQFDKWFAFDEFHGYHSCSYLDRIAKISDDWSYDDQVAEIERAIDEIVALNLTGNYKKVTRTLKV